MAMAELVIVCLPPNDRKGNKEIVRSKQAIAAAVIITA
jgi:hypothetical protein